MAVSIENDEVERLVGELAELTGETETEVVRRSLVERRLRLVCGVARPKRKRWMAFLEHEVWPTIPENELGLRLTNEEQDERRTRGDPGVRGTRIVILDPRAIEATSLRETVPSHVEL